MQKTTGSRRRSTCPTTRERRDDRGVVVTERVRVTDDRRQIDATPGSLRDDELRTPERTRRLGERLKCRDQLEPRRAGEAVRSSEQLVVAGGRSDRAPELVSPSRLVASPALRAGLPVRR